MSTPFAIEPTSNIFRAVDNGDNALSPSTPADVIFDAYGKKLQSVTLAGTVPYSDLGGAVSVAAVGGASSASLQSYQINFPQALDYIPFLFLQYQDASGNWLSTYIDNSSSGVNESGIILTNGSVGIALGYATPSSLTLQWYVANWPNPKSVTPPQAYSYRLFGV